MLRRGFIYFYILFLSSLLSAWAVYHLYEGDGSLAGTKTERIIKGYASIPSAIHDLFKSKFTISSPLLIENSFDKDGFHYPSDTIIYSGAMLISNFRNDDKGFQVNLVSLHNRSIMYQWNISRETLQKTSSKIIKNDVIRLWHPLLLSDKSIITICAGSDTSLVRIDTSGKIIWATHGLFHHSIEAGIDNDVWVCNNSYTPSLFKYGNDGNLQDNSICRVDIKTGKILFNKSVAQILVENGYTYLISLGKFEEDAIHLNDVQPATFTTDYWQKGDLLISIRNRNSVFLYRPKTDKIIWLKIGPWSNQHDADFIDSNRILIFGNDIIRAKRGMYFLNKVNNAYIYNFKTDSTTTPYTSLFKKEHIKTKQEGRCDIIGYNDIFVEDTENGRIVIGDSSQSKLIYTERYDERYIKRLNWVRFLSAKELTSLNLNK